MRNLQNPIYLAVKLCILGLCSMGLTSCSGGYQPRDPQPTGPESDTIRKIADQADGIGDGTPAPVSAIHFVRGKRPSKGAPAVDLDRRSGGRVGGWKEVGSAGGRLRSGARWKRKGGMGCPPGGELIL